MMNVAAPLDTLGNQASEMKTFMRRAKEIGPAAAFRERELRPYDRKPALKGQPRKEIS
jgi:hypothetical protein